MIVNFFYKGLLFFRGFDMILPARIRKPPLT